MNQEIKERLEQAAETAWEQDQKTNPTPVNPHAYVYGYKAGAQTILENPGEWGLVHPHSQKLAEEVLAMESQLAKYREALEKIANDPRVDDHMKAILIAEEALKQEDTTCPKCGYPLFKHLGKTCCQGCDYVKQQ